MFPPHSGINCAIPGKLSPEVRKVSDKYASLDRLLEQDAEARAFFSRLPEYVREQIRTRSDSINSFESLSDYADNLTRGEG